MISFVVVFNFNAAMKTSTNFPYHFHFYPVEDQLFFPNCDNGTRLVLPIVRTTKVTFLVEIRKVILSLSHQEKRKKALLESNLLGIS